MRAHRLTFVPAGILLGALLLLGAAPAVADDLEEEIEERIHRIEILVDEANELEESGHKEVARALHARVEGLEEEVRELRRELEARERREAREEDEEREEMVEELEGVARRSVGLFMRLLEAAMEEDEGRAEVIVKRLAGLAEELEEEMAHDDDDEGHEDDHDEGHEEDGDRHDRRVREHMEHAIELIHAAAKAFAEVENERLVEVMDRAAHVHRLLLEGAEKEAHRLIREHDLTWERMRELMLKAAHLYDEWGRERVAKALREFAHRGHEEPERHPDGAMPHEEALARIADLQEKVEAIMGMAHAVHEELEELKRALHRAR